MSKAKTVLGRGLGALISMERSESDTASISTLDVVQLERSDGGTVAGRVGTIEIAKVAPNPLQPRKEFAADALAELAASIREHGVIQAITVRRVDGGRYELVSGERRVRAAIEAGLTEIPAYVLDVESDRHMLELAIIENVQRQQFNPVEEAEAYQRLIDECSLTQEDVAVKIGKDRTTVTNFLRMLRLPDEIKVSLKSGELGMGHAKAILSIAEPSVQITLWNEAVRLHYSVRRLEDRVRQALGPSSVKRKAVTTTDDQPVTIEGQAMEDKWKQLFGTKVKLKVKSDDSGEIVIQFYNAEDLERIDELFHRLSSEH